MGRSLLSLAQERHYVERAGRGCRAAAGSAGAVIRFQELACMDKARGSETLTRQWAGPAGIEERFSRESFLSTTGREALHVAQDPIFLPGFRRSPPFRFV
jgi:hypothetical protein